MKQAPCFLYKLIYGFVNLELMDFFAFSASPYDLRFAGLKLNLERFKTSQRQFFFPVRIAKVWNALPSEVVTAKD